MFLDRSFCITCPQAVDSFGSSKCKSESFNSKQVTSALLASNDLEVFDLYVSNLQNAAQRGIKKQPSVDSKGKITDTAVLVAAIADAMCLRCVLLL